MEKSLDLQEEGEEEEGRKKKEEKERKKEERRRSTLKLHMEVNQASLSWDRTS